MLKELFFKIFSKEKMIAGVIGAALVALSAAVGADGGAIKKMVCEPPQQVEQSK
jgi:hypothetical protein